MAAFVVMSTLIAIPSVMSPVLADATISSKKPSTDLNTPVPLEIGEIVRGQLDNSEKTDTYHYWLVDLPAGKYKCVLDVRPRDGRKEWIGGSLQLFSPAGKKIDDIGRMFVMADRYREVFRFSLKKPLRAVLRYANDNHVSGYWLGIFQANAVITSPFFSACPKVELLRLGETGIALLAGGKPVEQDFYYSVALPAGEYKVTAEFRLVNEDIWVGGNVDVLGSDGDVQMPRIIKLFDKGPSTKATATLSLAEDATYILRVYTTVEGMHRASLTVEKLPQ